MTFFQPALESLPNDVLNYIVMFLRPTFEARFVLRFIKCFHRLPAVLAFRALELPHVRLCNFAAEAGAVALLQWLHFRLHFPWSAATCAAAAFGGHLEVLIWLRQ